MVIFIFGINNTTFAKDKVTLGVTGDYCKKFNSNQIEFKESKEVYMTLVQSEIRGFLTGYNIYVGIKERSVDNMKIINKDSEDFIFAYVLEYCKKNIDGAVFMGLVEYYNNLK